MFLRIEYYKEVLSMCSPVPSTKRYNCVSTVLCSIYSDKISTYLESLVSLILVDIFESVLYFK
jgi:hypothetical protein